MSKKSLLHTLFGFGKLPKKTRPVLEGEGIVLLDEGIAGTVILRKFRAPGRIHSYKRSGFAGSIVITGLRFAAFSFSRPLINVGLQDRRLNDLDLSLLRADQLCVTFEAGDFHDDWSGSVECRFRTPLAPQLLERLEQENVRRRA